MTTEKALKELLRQISEHKHKLFVYMYKEGICFNDADETPEKEYTTEDLFVMFQYRIFAGLQKALENVLGYDDVKRK